MDSPQDALPQSPANAGEVERLRSALERMVYEATHLSPCKPNGDHDCTVKADALAQARQALAGCSTATDTANVERLLNALAKVMPVRINNTADYAEVYFADGKSHSTQAMTVNPADWQEVSDAFRTLSTPPAQSGDGGDRLRNAAEELLECARLRGDDELPHPCDDPKLWTARMQDAWHELADALENGQ